MRQVVLVMFIALIAMGAAKKPPVQIRFYAQGSSNDAGSFSTVIDVDGRPVYLIRTAVLSEKDIAAYYPAQASDGSMGAYFKLTEHGRMKLYETTVSKRGSVLVPFFNNRQCQHMVIDSVVEDGVIGIPSGLTTDDIVLIDQKFRMMGEPKKRR